MGEATRSAGDLFAGEYDSAARPPPVLGEFKELLRYRDLLRLLIAKTIKTRYKRSFLGVVWTLLSPLLSMAVMTVAFSTLFKGSVANYPVYLLAGLICWNFFTQTTTYAMSSLMWSGGLLHRVYVPRTIFAVASIGNGLVNLVITMIPLLLIMVATGHSFHATWWFMPFAILVLATFALGVALLMSTLAVFFFDVLEFYQVVLQAWFFLTPVIYPKEIFPAQYVWALHFNPLYHILELFRAPIVVGTLPASSSMLLAAAWAVGALLLGWWALAKKADEFAYRL